MDIDIKVTSHKNYSIVDVKIEGRKYPVSVSAYHDEPDCLDENPKPEVNWSALGNVSPEIARAYASAIIKAADIAENIFNERNAEKIKPSQDESDFILPPIEKIKAANKKE